MSLPVLALFNRELSRDGRARSTYYLRMIPLGLLGLYTLGLLTNRSGLGAPGLAMFHTVMRMNFVGIWVFALSHFAVALSEEKEAGTVALLRMTRLGPAAMLFGKVASRASGAALFLLVQTPLTMLSLSLGGLGMRQVAAAYIVLAGWLMAAIGIATLASLICQTNRQARRAVLVCLAGWIIGVPLAASILRALFKNPGGFYTLLSGLTGYSPFVEINVVLGTSFGTGPLLSLRAWSNAAAGAVLLGICWLLFDRFTRERAARRAMRMPRRVEKLLRTGRYPVWNDAICWKDFHFVLGGWPGVALRAFVYLAVVIAVALIDKEWIPILPVIFGLGICLDAGLMPVRSFTAEFHGKTLSSLILLPMDTGELIRRKRRACALTLTPSILATACALWAGATFGDIPWNYALLLYTPLIILGGLVAQASGWYVIYLTVRHARGARPALVGAAIKITLLVALIIFAPCFSILGIIGLIYWIATRMPRKLDTVIPKEMEELAAQE